LRAAAVGREGASLGAGPSAEDRQGFQLGVKTLAAVMVSAKGAAGAFGIKGL
jgi:hypothetical protein